MSIEPRELNAETFASGLLESEIAIMERFIAITQSHLKKNRDQLREICSTEQIPYKRILNILQMASKTEYGKLEERIPEAIEDQATMARAANKAYAEAGIDIKYQGVGGIFGQNQVTWELLGHIGHELKSLRADVNELLYAPGGPRSLDAMNSFGGAQISRSKRDVGETDAEPEQQATKKRARRS